MGLPWLAWVSLGEPVWACVGLGGPEWHRLASLGIAWHRLASLRSDIARSTKALEWHRQPDNMSEPPPPKRARSGAMHAALKEEIESQFSQGMSRLYDEEQMELQKLNAI